MLGAISLVIMLTAAISFYGSGEKLATAADVARQLEHLFGPAALALFCLGLFAGAFSSFMVNAMIGGAMLSDGLGLGGKMDSVTTKIFTTIALLVGMLVAILAPDKEDRVGLLVFAQAMVLIGFPLLAISMLYLATRPDLKGERAIPLWLKIAAAAGSLFVLAGACVTGWKILAPLCE
jgi:Mn2+/Fe2+ NRAMP family transporter